MIPTLKCLKALVVPWGTVHVVELVITLLMWDNVLNRLDTGYHFHFRVSDSQARC